MFDLSTNQKRLILAVFFGLVSSALRFHCYAGTTEGYFEAAYNTVLPSSSYLTQRDHFFFRKFGKYLMFVLLHYGSFPNWLDISVMKYLLHDQQGAIEIIEPYDHVVLRHLGEPISTIVALNDEDHAATQMTLSLFSGEAGVNPSTILSMYQADNPTHVNYKWRKAVINGLLYGPRFSSLEAIKTGFQTTIDPGGIMGMRCEVLAKFCYIECTTIADFKMCLKAAEEYTDVRDHAPLQFVHAALDRLHDNQGPKLLAWCTGTKRVPLWPKVRLNFIHNVMQERMPHAHTCSRTIDISLGRYTDADGQHYNVDLLLDDLTAVITNWEQDSTGFGHI